MIWLMLTLFFVVVGFIISHGVPREHGCIPRRTGQTVTCYFQKRVGEQEGPVIVGELANCLCGVRFVMLPTGFPRKWEELE